MSVQLAAVLKKYGQDFSPVVPFHPSKDKICSLDFTADNLALTPFVLEHTDVFCSYVDQVIKEAGALYAIGGYGEHRTVYSRSKVFDASRAGEEPRRLHLGIDIWGKEQTPVYAPLGGMVHSFAFNNQLGDYGATIILLHQLEGVPFYTLYGHLSLPDIAHLKEGSYISRGQEFAHFGAPSDNGQWPPHLHFQIIGDMEYRSGDYPGVCRFSEKDHYLLNCPDPDLILNMNQYLQY